MRVYDMHPELSLSYSLAKTQYIPQGRITRQVYLLIM